MKYEFLPWDTDFFGLSIGRITPEKQGAAALAGAVEEADAAGIHCLFLLCPVDDLGLTHEASDLGFRTYDVRMELSRPVEESRAPEEVRPSQPGDAEALERLASERIRDTRFWSDPRFPRSRVEELYVEWLRRGVSDHDHRTLVLGEVAGFVTCRLDREASVGTIELIAVAADQAGRGLGSKLVAAANAAFAAAGLERAGVVTQGRNVAAQRLYQAQGYRTERLGVWMHRWRTQA